MSATKRITRTDEGKTPPRTRKREAAPAIKQSDPEARRRAAAVLEVLGGVASPPTAAVALGISLPRYYAMEQRALEGLVTACVPPCHRGRRVTPAREVEKLRTRIATLEREAARFQAMARMAYRAAGLSSPTNKSGGGAESGKAGTSGKGKRSRRPVVRALAVAEVLRGPAVAAGGSAEAPPPSAASSPPQRVAAT